MVPRFITANFHPNPGRTANRDVSWLSVIEDMFLRSTAIKQLGEMWSANWTISRACVADEHFIAEHVHELLRSHSLQKATGALFLLWHNSWLGGSGASRLTWAGRTSTSRKCLGESIRSGEHCYTTLATHKHSAQRERGGGAESAGLDSTVLGELRGCTDWPLPPPRRPPSRASPAPPLCRLAHWAPTALALSLCLPLSVSVALTAHPLFSSAQFNLTPRRCEPSSLSLLTELCRARRARHEPGSGTGYQVTKSPAERASRAGEPGGRAGRAGRGEWDGSTL